MTINVDATLANLRARLDALEHKRVAEADALNEALGQIYVLIEILQEMRKQER